MPLERELPVEHIRRDRLRVVRLRRDVELAPTLRREARAPHQLRDPILAARDAERAELLVHARTAVARLDLLVNLPNPIR